MVNVQVFVDKQRNGKTEKSIGQHRSIDTGHKNMYNIMLNN